MAYENRIRKIKKYADAMQERIDDDRAKGIPIAAGRLEKLDDLLGQLATTVEKQVKSSLRVVASTVTKAVSVRPAIKAKMSRYNRHGLRILD